jgi:hypothetical protein
MLIASSDEDETCDSCTADCHSEADCGYCGDGLCAADENGGAGTVNSGHCDQVVQKLLYRPGVRRLEPLVRFYRDGKVYRWRLP